MEIGDNVRLVQPVITGVILDTEYDKSTKQLRHLIEYSTDNEQQQRWFVESDLEALP